MRPLRIAAPADESRYDILMAAPAGRPREILAAALNQAFQISVRRETAEAEVLVLTVPKVGAALREPAAKGSSMSQGKGRLTAINSTLYTLVSLLEDKLKQFVVDETGLSGPYDFELRWDESKPESLPVALREQLGFELQPGRRPIEKLIVTKAE